MHTLTQSYVHGASAMPLIGETIGVHFDKAVARWPETKRWWCAIKACAGRIASCNSMSMPLPPGSWLWGWARGTGWDLVAQ